MIRNATIRNADGGFYLNGAFEGRTFEAGSVNGGAIFLYAINTRTTEMFVDLTTLTLENTTGADVTPSSIQERAELLSQYVSKKKVNTGGASGSINPNHIFANAAARDTYFTTRFDELVTGLEIILEDDGSSNRVLQRWLGESNLSSYPANPSNFWQDIGGTALTAAEIKTLYESNPQTNALLDMARSILDQLTLANNEVTSAISWNFPAGSINVGNLKVDSANHTIGAVNEVDDQKGFGVVQRYDDNGSSLPLSLEFGAVITTDAQPLTDQTQPSSPYSFSFPVPSDFPFRVWYGMTLRPAAAGDFSFQVTVNGVVIAEAFTTFQQSDVDNDNDVFVELTNVVLLEANEATMVTFTGALTKGTEIMGSFVPRFAAREQTVTPRPLATQEYVQQQMNYQAPQLLSFGSDLPSTVNGGTVISGSHTFTFSVSNSSNIQGNLTLAQDGTNLRTDIVPTSSPQNATVTTVTLAAGESTIFTLSGVDTMGQTFSRSIQVRARQQAESFYYGVSADITPANIDINSLTLVDVFAGSTVNASFDIPTTQYAVIFSPTDREISSILDNTFNQEILADFVKTEGARTIGGEVYDLYTHQNNAGVQGILSTTITLS